MNNLRKSDCDRLIPQSTTSFNYTDTSGKELRKIDGSDKFPCYSCYDQPVERINCTVCNKMGYIMGDHPMVKFVDDFLTQNLTSYLNTLNPNKESYINDSHSSDE